MATASRSEAFAFRSFDAKRKRRWAMPARPKAHGKLEKTEDLTGGWVQHTWARQKQMPDIARIDCARVRQRRDIRNRVGRRKSFSLPVWSTAIITMATAMGASTAAATDIAAAMAIEVNTTTDAVIIITTKPLNGDAAGLSCCIALLC
jgi:hypothetical protein